MSSASKIIQAAAGNAAGEGLYVEEVFSTYLYDGNGSTQTITNDIDLDGEGGLVWVKGRDATWNHFLLDTERGPSSTLFSHLNLGAYIDPTDGSQYSITSFNSDGFSLKNNDVNNSAREYASWTFRKAPKFFDVVTYTGTGSARTVSHNLGSVPGCIMVKRTDTAVDWKVYHRSTGNTKWLELNTTSAEQTATQLWNDTTPTDTVFTVGTDSSVNASGGSFVAYLFAHNNGDGEFGESGDQDIIKCGSFTTDGGEQSSTTLGWEPQFLLIKKTNQAQDWFLADNMRGMPVGTDDAMLYPNLNSAEAGQNRISINPTGFTTSAFGASSTFIYIAIRRGPMKTPESGTEVFSPVVYSGSGSTRTLDATIVPDIYMGNTRTPSGGPVGVFVDRLRGNSKYVRTYDTSAETGTSPSRDFSNQTGFTLDGNADNVSGRTYVTWFMRRAPGFFDVVAYTGTGSATTVDHNLGVVPELIIVKNRDQTDAWQVYAGDETDYLVLNTNAATADNVNRWNDTAPTASVFTIGTAAEVNTNTEDYIAYLFATLDGISKVFSVTKSSGSDATVDCGFSAGARFVLIKRTDSTGDWYVWDTERGIVAGDDPYLLLNSTAAEVTNTDYIDPDSSGFVIVDNGLADGDYIGLAIA